MLCEHCKTETDANPSCFHIHYIFMGCDPLRVDVALCTWFHALLVKPPCAPNTHGESLRFGEGETVLEFLQQQSTVLPFDNKLHYTRWELVHVSRYIHRFESDLQQTQAVYQILDHRFLMNNIPPSALAFLQIHALDGNLQRATQYIPELLGNNDRHAEYFAANTCDTPLHVIPRTSEHVQQTNAMHHARTPLHKGHGMWNMGMPYAADGLYRGCALDDGNCIHLHA